MGDRVMGKLSFSQRMGLEIEKAIQKEGIDRELRTALWNIVYTFSEDVIEDYEERWYLQNHIWRYFYVLPRDEMQGNIFNDWTKKFILKKEWNLVYDLVQEYVEYFSEKFEYLLEAIIKNINDELEEHNAAYRLVDNLIIPISSQSEVDEIKDVLEKSKSRFANVYTHLSMALKHLSEREKPDYRNSVKESISAVESLCKLISGDSNADLGKALAEIEKEGKIELHGALKKGFNRLYDYTSDAGVRHGMKSDPNLDVEDARYMLVTCSAFINYLIVKADKAEIF